MSVSSGACVLATRGEVEGSSSVCARGVCVDPAGCLLPTVHATPALACGRTLPPGEVEPDTAQASWLAAALSSVAGAGEVSGGTHNALAPCKSRFPSRARGARPEGRDLPSYASTCTQYPDPKVWSWERELSTQVRPVPRSLSETHGFPLPDALVQEGEPAVGTCPEGRADGALEHPERVVYGPDSYTLGQCAQRVQSPRTLPIRVAPAFPVSGIQRSRPGYPESPGAPEARRLCASAGTGTQGLSDHSSGCETETEGKAKCAVKGRVFLKRAGKEHLRVQTGLLACENPWPFSRLRGGG